MSAGSPRGNSIDVLIGIPHLWTSASVVQGVKRMECKYCRKLILAGGFICEVCSFPIHKQCMLKDNIISCGNVAPYQLQQRAKLAHFLEKRPPKINSKARAAVSRTTWQRRWFILTKDCNIFYYKEKTSSTPKGVISLTKYDTVESLPKRKMRLYNQTDASVREYHLRAPSEEIQSLWVKEIENLIEQGKKGILGLAQDLHTREVNSRMNQTTKTVPKLKVKVTEGKNFPTSLSGMSPSVYCIISCGFEFRQTLTIWNSESPVWDEEYDLENFDPDKDVFRCFVMEDSLLLTDSDIGIVEKPVSSLGLEVHDKWCPIQAPPLQHVTGDIHIQLARRGNVLTVMILECNHLAAQDPNGLSDPYVTLACGSVKKKTQIIKKNLNPYFGEAFQFNVEESVLPIEVVVWDWDRIGLNDFLGQVIIPESDIPKSGRCDKRYLLEPQKVSAKAPDESKSLGELRLRLVYTEQRVYPLTVYLSLLGLLMAQDIPFVKALVPIIPDKAAVAACLVKIFDSNLESLRLVQDLTSTEIEATDDPSIIFRGNTLITKSMDSFMKYSGGSYLRLILGPLVTEVNNLNQSYEVDPLKASSGEDVSKNAAKLATLCQNFLDRIFNSVPHCPLVMKAAFTHIRSIVMSKYTKDQILVVKYTSVSAFIFLRFFCPAIQNPKSHGLVERLTPTTARTFTLVAKILQNLANLVEFGEKEPYMKRLNIFIVDNKEQMKVFLNNISLVKDIPDTKIGISEDLWLEKELSTMTQFLTASFDQISNTLEPSLLHEFHTVMNQMKTAMEEQDLLEAEGS